MHLNGEQFEEALARSGAHQEHLAACSQCREALAGMRALRARLRAAHEGVHAPAELAMKIRRETVGGSMSAEERPPWHPAVQCEQHAGQAPPLTKPTRHGARFPRVWRYASLAAAAMVLLAVGLTMQLWPSGATAAQVALADIHQQNVAAMAKGGSDVFCGDMDQMQTFIKGKTGCTPLTPCCGDGTEINCCCVQKFRGKSVGCYVLKTPQGPVSLVVLPDKIETLGMNKSVEAAGHKFNGCSARGSNIVACSVGQYTYCAVGNVGHEQLADVMAAVIKGR